MLRWRLSTVRALGGRDTNTRSSYLFSPQTLRPSRCHFVCIHSGTAVTVADPVEEPYIPVVGSSPAQSCPIEDCSTHRVACSRISYSAIDTLRRCLSPENVTSDRPLICSPTTIRSLYYRAESRSQLGMLDSEMLTLLIGLFASLSTDPCAPVLYREPLASRILRMSKRRTHWAFVLKVGRYKSERGIPLQDSDRFWLMRAELATVQAGRPSESLLGDAYRAVLRARTHYHIIRRHSRRPEVHAHYLDALLTLGDPRLLDFAACDLAFLLRNHRACHPRLQHLLYRLVIRHGEFLSTRSREAILTALWSRSCRGAGGTPEVVLRDNQSGIDLDSCILDATTIACSLSTTLLDFAGHVPNEKITNSLGHLFSVFSPAYTLPLRWNLLILFSVFNTSEALHFNGTPWTSGHAKSEATSFWQVIFGLAIVEKIMSHKLSSAFASQPTPTDGVLETTRSLYQLWLSAMKSRLGSRDLACAVATSFLRIASVLADATLFYDCQDICHEMNGLEVPWTPVRSNFAAQYIAAAVRVQGPLPDVVSRALEALSLDIKQQHQVLASAVEALAHVDASLAYTLYTVAQGRGVELDRRAIYALAISFARRGSLRQAIYLTNDQFSPEERGILVSAIARSLRENPRTRHPPSVFIAVVDELAILYHSHVPPEHFQGHLEQLFVVLAQHGRGSQLFPVIFSIFKRSPKFFQPRFFVRYCHALIRRRQFSTIRKLLDAITAVHSKTARSLSSLTDRIVLQTRTFRMSKRITPLRGPISLRLSSHLRRYSYAGLPLGISLQKLLNLGRVLVAKRIFTRAAPTISCRQRTTFGNVLLHGVSRQSTSRNGRRVRKVLALLENLIKDHGFRPDRVTVNILIKAMIGWRSAFDSSRLRELFDQLVKGGYPAANYSPLHLPFDTGTVQLSGSPGFSKLSSFVSFEKHTRPLFKMFIKAFYSCNDVGAARKVVAILKVEEYKNTVAKEARRRARSRGRAKAGQMNAIPLDATVSSID